MKQLVKENLLENSRTPEDSHYKGYMTINDFSEVMSEFYNDINKLKSYLDEETIGHLIKAKEELDKAWQNETEAHGVEFEEYPMFTGYGPSVIM